MFAPNGRLTTMITIPTMETYPPHVKLDIDTMRQSQDAQPSTFSAGPQQTAHSMGDNELPPRGYGTMAKAMGSESETAIFRRFSALSMESLLHYQAELTRLENALKRQQEIDSNSSEENRRSYVLDSWARRMSTGHIAACEPVGGVAEGLPDAAQQWELMNDIRVTLKRYRKLICAFIHTIIMDRTSHPKSGRSGIGTPPPHGSLPGASL